MSSTDPRNRPQKSGRGRRRGGPPPSGTGTAGEAGAGAQPAATGATKARKRVDPTIQIGIVAAPADVVARAQHSRLVQADGSSEPLTERVVGPWVDRTPEQTVIDVRAHRLLTHHAAPADTVWPEVRDLLPPALRERRQLYAEDLPARALDEALDRFLASIAPLREFAKLGAVVFPFPSYFQPDTRALDYLEWLRDRSGDTPIAVELRNRQWVAGKQRDITLPFLESHRLAYVCVDVPSGFDSSLPPLAVATTDTAFVRFHGRNADAWERDADVGDDRFSYEYRDVDLEPWVARLEKLVGSAKAVHVVFSGRSTEGATRNARLLVCVLSSEPSPTRRAPPVSGRPRRRPPAR